MFECFDMNGFMFCGQDMLWLFRNFHIEGRNASGTEISSFGYCFSGECKNRPRPCFRTGGLFKQGNSHSQKSQEDGGKKHDSYAK